MPLTCLQFWNLLIQDALGGDELAEEEYEAIDEHVDTCPACARRIEPPTAPATFAN